MGDAAVGAIRRCDRGYQAIGQQQQQEQLDLVRFQGDREKQNPVVGLCSCKKVKKRIQQVK